MFEILKKIFFKPRGTISDEVLDKWNEKLASSKPGMVTYIPNDIFDALIKRKSTDR